MSLSSSFVLFYSGFYYKLPFQIKKYQTNVMWQPTSLLLFLNRVYRLDLFVFRLQLSTFMFTHQSNLKKKIFFETRRKRTPSGSLPLCLHLCLSLSPPSFGPGRFPRTEFLGRGRHSQESVGSSDRPDQSSSVGLGRRLRLLPTIRPRPFSLKVVNRLSKKTFLKKNKNFWTHFYLFISLGPVGLLLLN